MQKETGQISIHAANMMPIIKKWLYSDRDIFLREIISNAYDATRKREVIGQEIADRRIDIIADEKEGTLSIIDHGVGMTDEEVRRYINQVAFSGAQEFVKNYEAAGDIIGHFGLGFYSAFMVADWVSIDTLSCLEGAQAIKWQSAGGLDYEMQPSDRAQVGTCVTIKIADDAKEFLTQETLQQTLEKYCSFMPIPIYLTAGDEVQGPINDVHPLYIKPPRECTKEEYDAFYTKTFHQWEAPLFHIHLNVDYPFNLKGILYFPRLQSDFRQDGVIKLYANQVFVADNIREIVPEFLLLLKGVIDCPDIPLNVSRSFLQNDGYVKRLSAHIVRKVADKIVELFESDRAQFESYWDDIEPFVKYGCLRDESFYDRVKDALLYKNSEGGYVTVEEYKKALGEQGESAEILYASDGERQASTIALLRQQGAEVVLMQNALDTPFMQFIELKGGISFVRVDAKLHKGLEGETAEDAQGIIEIFKAALGEDEHLKVEARRLEVDTVPALLLSDENIRRFRDASRIWGSQGMEIPQEQTLVLNLSHPLIERLAKGELLDNAKDICLNIYDLAQMAQAPLDAQRMTAFIQRTTRLLSALK